ncbi:MAG: MBL fold metallo-hydrolase [Thermoanaerobaculia bacterium]
MTDRMSPPKGGVVVRMYCTGLGDCFLLGFPDHHGETSYVLIDCGVWKGTPGATAWMRRIMEHIRDEVRGRGLDLLVATHQHWDHLSGFSQAKDVFESIKVKQVWMPWTEDPEDRTALRMAQERRLALRAAVAAVSRLRAGFTAENTGNASALRTRVENLEAVLKFAGYTPPEDADARRDDVALAGLGFGASADLLGAGPGTDDLLEIVRRKVAKPRYLRPSLKPLSFSHLPGVRIYALGPPTDPRFLGKDDPSTVPGRSEVYVADLPVSEAAALYAAASSHPCNSTSFADQELCELTYPFDRWQRCSRDEARDGASELGQFFRARYWDGPDWRRIDEDWLEAASQLALNLDDHVNNTSLALAFELGEDGPVLLFPGDAQVGNWLSWHELESVNGVTAESLLNRTVLYKVGHHGSHNATLKARGLKLMTDTSQLVAMVPVDESEARKPKGGNKDGWAMPYDKLLADLMARTEGRVLRADLGPVKPRKGDIPGWNDAKKKRWERFRDEVVVETAEAEIDGAPVSRTLFLQYTVR